MESLANIELLMVRLSISTSPILTNTPDYKKSMIVNNQTSEITSLISEVFIKNEHRLRYWAGRKSRILDAYDREEILSISLITTISTFDISKFKKRDKNSYGTQTIEDYVLNFLMKTIEFTSLNYIRKKAKSLKREFSIDEFSMDERKELNAIRIETQIDDNFDYEKLKSKMKKSLQTFSDSDKKILQFYLKSYPERKKLEKALLDELGISSAHLRVKIHRLKAKLRMLLKREFE